MGAMDTANIQLNERLCKLGNLLIQSTVPLFSFHKGVPQLEGSGTLIKNRGQLFLVSAAHVLDKCKTTRLAFYCDAKTLLNIHGKITLSLLVDGKRDRDLIDLGVVKLGPDTAKHLRIPKPLSFDVLQDTKVTDSCSCFITGYPASRAKPNIPGKYVQTEPFFYRGRVADSATYKAQAIDSRHNLLIKFDRKNCLFPDGSVKQAPDPHGISGSPVWFLWDEEDLERNKHSQLICGFVIEQEPKHKLLLATNAAFAREAILSLMR